jgi:osmotically-inducible protein OsmY
MRFLALTVATALLFGTTACVRNSAAAASPSKVDESQIKDNLRLANLDRVQVAVNNEKRVVTLQGDVISAAEKEQAEDIARTNAEGYYVANAVSIRSWNTDARRADSKVDMAIKLQWKVLETQNDWEKQHIRARVKNRVLTLKGDVDTPTERDTVERSAAQIAGVQRVVNDLSVKSASR